ncbi:MAG: htpG [Proteobacteria bacterium]|nr:htpG [Pseudomonadota bacterium]
MPRQPGPSPPRTDPAPLDSSLARQHIADACRLSGPFIHESETMTQTERHSFEAEVSRLLHLMVHAVYSNKDIFLRELISNAADACEKLRYLSIAEPQLAGEGGFAITLSADKDNKTLVVADNGIGMSHDELKDNLGTIARSGTRAFLEGLADKAEGQALIGQFGVGFYSAFMVASRVRVVSRKAGSEEAWAWEGAGARHGGRTVPPRRGADLRRGTYA